MKNNIHRGSCEAPTARRNMKGRKNSVRGEVWGRRKKKKGGGGGCKLVCWLATSISTDSFCSRWRTESTELYAVTPRTCFHETFIRWQQSAEEEISIPSRLSCYHLSSRLCINHLQLWRVSGVKNTSVNGCRKPIVTDPATIPDIIRVDESLSMLSSC